MSKPTVPPARTPGELRNHSAEHLHYELGMLFETARRLESQQQPKSSESDESDPHQDDVVVTNALIESFAIHARGLALFLHPDATSARYANAVTADEYVTDGDHWRKDRGAIPSVLRTVIDRTGKEIAHLTIERHPAGSSDKAWNPDTILRAFLPPLRAFAAQVATERLDATVTAFLASLPQDPLPPIIEVQAPTDRTTERITIPRATIPAATPTPTQAIIVIRDDAR